MNRWHRLSRVVLTLIAAAVVASVTVSAAEAGQGRGRGYGNGRYKRSYARPVMTRRVVVSRPSYAYARPYYRPRYASRVYYRPAYGMYRVGRPVSGGYLAFGTGGFAFGFSLSNRPAGYYYMDPFCHTRFHSLAAYHDHCRVHRHETVVRVIHENAPGHQYRDYDQGPREDWNDSGPHDDWNNGDDSYHDEQYDQGWNDKEERRDWNDPDDDDYEDDDGR